MLLRHIASQFTTQRTEIVFSGYGGLLQLSVIYRGTNAAWVPAAYALFVILSGVFCWVEAFVF